MSFIIIIEQIISTEQDSDPKQKTDQIRTIMELIPLVIKIKRTFFSIIFRYFINGFEMGGTRFLKLSLFYKTFIKIKNCLRVI